MKKPTLILPILLIIVPFGEAVAGPDDNVFSVPANIGAYVDGTFSVTTVFDNGIADAQGWSYGLCHDPALATVDSVDLADTATVKNGSPADFIEMTIYLQGFTQGVVICFTGCATVAPGTVGFQMATGNYTAIAEGNGSIEFCGILGTPPVAVVAVYGGASLIPLQNNGILEVVEVPDPEFEFRAGSAAVNYPSVTGLDGIAMNARFSIAEIDNSAMGAPFPSDTVGFSMGFANDETLVTPTAVNVNLPLLADFEESSIQSGGWTLGVIYSLTIVVVLHYPAATEVVDVDYEGVSGALTGIEGTTSTPLTMDDTLGTPPFSNVIVIVDGSSFPATGVSGQLEFTGTIVNPYVAGDCNGDSVVNIADIIWSIAELYSGGPSSNCDIACDANGDGAHDAGDPVYTVSYIFLSGTPPVGPSGCESSPGQQLEECQSPNCGP